jgi:hypothetical protein
MNIFEFAAHEECIDDPFIHDKVIPRRAERFAQQLLDCTMPLLEAHADMSEDYAAIADEWREAKQQLAEIFKQALYAKVRLLLSTDTYMCDFHMHGTPFNSDIMHDGAEGLVHGTDSKSDGVVDITIFPGLIRYATKEEDFNYNRFSVVRKRAPEGVGAEVLKKAVVLIK